MLCESESLGVGEFYLHFNIGEKIFFINSGDVEIQVKHIFLDVAPYTARSNVSLLRHLNADTHIRFKRVQLK